MNPKGKIKILGIYGSLRNKSYNKALLKTAQELNIEEINLEIFPEMSEIPLFDQDREKNLPPAVVKLKEMIRSSDAILFATPEYNYSFPGVLKNAIDWASRPYGDNSWEQKPVAIMSASVGMLGGIRAQYQLRQTFIFLNMFPINKPEVIIPMANEKFDDQGKLIDSHTRDKISELLSALADWTRRIRIEERPVKELNKERLQYQNAYAAQEEGERRYMGGKPNE